jgi:hypothetical protein
MITRETTLKELAHMLLTNDEAEQEYRQFIDKLAEEMYNEGYYDAEDNYT